MRVQEKSSEKGTVLTYDPNNEDVFGQFQNQQIKFMEAIRKQNKNSNAIEFIEEYNKGKNSEDLSSKFLIYDFEKIISDLSIELGIIDKTDF